MKFLQFTQAKTVLGIDISSTTVKMVELDKKDSRYVVNAFAVEPLAEGTVFEREIKNPTALADAIKRCTKKAKSKCKNVVIAVPDQAVVQKEIDAPIELLDFDLEDYVVDVAPNHIPYALDEVAMDFAPLGKDPRATDRQLLQLVAAKLEQLEDRTGCIRAAGLTPMVVDVESYAYEHVLPLIESQLDTDYSQSTLAFIDAGATETQFNVVNRGRQIYSRSINFGGRSLTEDIMRRYGMSFPEAGRAKRSGELPEDYATSLLQPFMRQMAAEISRAMQIYSSNGEGPEPQSIILTGGCAAIPGIDKIMTEVTGLSSAVFNPFKQMKTRSKVDTKRLADDGCSLVVACGLALRGLQ